ncbi:MAG: glycosyltransferase family 2 protein [Gammaproteobacteria bacterium]
MSDPGFPLSVLIVTLNEERNLPACLDGVAWADDIVVFDSHSTDATVEIARARGARVVQRVFDDFSSHRNWALNHVDFAHEWVLLLDADECVTDELAKEIRSVLEGGTTHDAFMLRFRFVWRGRWLKHGARHPVWGVRLLRVGRGSYENRLVHEHIVVSGSVGRLRHFLHEDDDKGLERYIDRHNHYSTLEAVEVARARRGHVNVGVRLLGGPARRRALKNWAYRYVPARPLFVFLYVYFMRLGFLDGRGGFESAMLRAIYEFQIDLKLRELAVRGSPLEHRWRDYIEGGR